MSESYGGTFMVYLFMIFFVIYVFIIGVALNFAKIYRVKNNVINILEQYQYKGDNTDNIVYEKLDAYLKSVPYKVSQESSTYINDCQNRTGGKENSKSYDQTLIDKGVCVVRKGEANKYYYSVTVYYVAELPIMNLTIPITASGETIVIS